MVTVGVVSPGAMGGALGRGWAEAGARVVATVSGRSPRTRGLAHGLELLPALEDVVAASDVVVSVVPPGSAYDVALAVAAAARSAGVAPLFADLNAVSPATVARIASALAPLDLVDGSISGGPPDSDVTRVYLSGSRSSEVVALSHPRLDVRVVPGPPGVASAVKMCTASVYKGFSAILLHAVATAEANGVRDLVLDDLSREYADMVAGLAPRLAVAGAKAHRFAGEMREIAATQEAAGLPRELFEAVALVWENAAASPLGSATPEEARGTADVGEVVRRLLSPGAP
jgi:3-hydroxyisobutyrate dehydrogenase-like beta-hydroxyacid dehydrogenase